jgi:hypothetical protein
VAQRRTGRVSGTGVQVLLVGAFLAVASGASLLGSLSCAGCGVAARRRGCRTHPSTRQPWAPRDETTAQGPSSLPVVSVVRTLARATLPAGQVDTDGSPPIVNSLCLVAVMSVQLHSYLRGEPSKPAKPIHSGCIRGLSSASYQIRPAWLLFHSRQHHFKLQPRNPQCRA